MLDFTSVICFLIYEKRENIDSVTKSTHKFSLKLFQWLSKNQMNKSAHKCHLVMSTNKFANISINDSVEKKRLCKVAGG